MRFLVTKELTESPTWRRMLLGLSLFILLFLLLDIWMHHHQIGLDTGTAKVTLFGDEATFEAPMVFGPLLMVVHIDLFVSMFVLLLLGALYIRLFSASRGIKVQLHLLFGSGLLAPLSLAGVYLIGVGVEVWIGLFLLWHLVAFGMALRIIGRLW